MLSLRSLARRALPALALAVMTIAVLPSAAAEAGSERENDAQADTKKKGDDAKPKKKAGDAKPKKKRGNTKKKGNKQAARGDKRSGPMSIGAPNHGSLVGSVRLKQTKFLRVRTGTHTWGLPVLVKALRRAAGRVARKHGRSVMLVGDLSARKGGPIEGHGAHQSGRDADIGFYLTNSKGKPVHLKRFVEFDGKGKAVAPSWARFDDERNWALVQALLSDKDAGVRYVFVSSALRARLLAFAAKAQVPKDIVARAAAAMRPSGDGDANDDHFHVRIACPKAMRSRCVEQPVPH